MESHAVNETHITHDAKLSVIIMIIASIIIGYYLTMTIILRDNKTDNRNKMYQSLLMGFWMGLVEIIMFILFAGLNQLYLLIAVLLIIGIIILSYLIYFQVGINENQFMLSMIEHHQMAIEMVRLNKHKTKNSDLLKIMDNIERSQREEIADMRILLKQNKVPDNITSLFY